MFTAILSSIGVNFDVEKHCSINVFRHKNMPTMFCNLLTTIRTFLIPYWSTCGVQNRVLASN